MADDIDALLDEAEDLVSIKSSSKPSRTRDYTSKAPSATRNVFDAEVDELMNELNENCGDQVRINAALEIVNLLRRLLLWWL